MPKTLENKLSLCVSAKTNWTSISWECVGNRQHTDVAAGDTSSNEADSL